jgi:hypothetical protein
VPVLLLRAAEAVYCHRRLEAQAQDGLGGAMTDQLPALAICR